MLSFLFFGVVFVALLVPVVAGREPFLSMSGVFLLLCGAFPVAGIAYVPHVARRPGAGGGPNALQWCFLLLGAGMWSAAPIVGLLSSAGWDALIGSGAKAVPLWFLAIITWGVTALILSAGYRQLRRRAAGRV